MKRVTVAQNPDDIAPARCPRLKGTATLLRTADATVTEQRVSAGRTTALVLGLLALLVAVAAYGASQIQPGFPSGPY